MLNFKTLLIFLLFVLFIFCKENDNGFTIPLMRHKSPREIGMNINNIKEFSTKWLKPYYHYSSKPAEPNNDSIAIYRYLDSEFYGIIQIGKKARPFNLVLDTAWGHTWVISNDCPYQTVGCWFHNKYDHDKSSTYIENGTEITINLETYNLTGYFSQDTFHLEQLNVTNQTFIEMIDIPYYYILSKADGVLGLGYNTLANGVTPIFYNLIKQGHIKKALFSVYLNRDKSSNRGGNVIFGRIEKRHILHPDKNKITYLPVNQTGYWQFKMDRVVLDDGKKSFLFCNDGCQAIADTSTNAIMGPGLDIRKINRLMRATYVAYGRYQVDCDTINKLPEISFIIGGKNFTLHGRDYVQQMSYKSFTVCMSAYLTSKKIDVNLWVLGGAFLSEFYSIYDLDNNQIGFVKAA